MSFITQRIEGKGHETLQNLSSEQKRVINDFGSWEKFMHQYGLKPFDSDDVDEGIAILNGLVEIDRREGRDGVAPGAGQPAENNQGVFQCFEDGFAVDGKRYDITDPEQVKILKQYGGWDQFTWAHGLKAIDVGPALELLHKMVTENKK
ncbi:hypothetical protein I316_02804 [Kwoniella heveanensis BCC8398]|uniref:Uncharacterized protein n=1 Tax=Kwoniella heveanensis BCC8398 TaxID=1296120 RepID=A0A1B9GW49_9TREE|nr:hypothetical protein I316_02804 [Kwoniella heveanensis BCC8398]